MSMVSSNLTSTGFDLQSTWESDVPDRYMNWHNYAVHPNTPPQILSAITDMMTHHLGDLTDFGSDEPFANTHSIDDVTNSVINHPNLPREAAVFWVAYSESLLPSASVVGHHQHMIASRIQTAARAAVADSAWQEKFELND